MKLTSVRGRNPGSIVRILAEFETRDECIHLFHKYSPMMGYSTQANPAVDVHLPKEPFLPPTPLVVTQLAKENPELKIDDKLKEWYLKEVQRRVRAKKYANDVHESEQTKHLRPSQRSGARFAYAMKRVLCADDTGTGKSWTALTVASMILTQKPDAKILILTLKNLIPQWAVFASKLIKEPCEIFELGNPTKRRGKFQVINDLAWAAVAISNWECLLTNTDELLTTKWDFIIGDEAHVLCNRKAKRTEAMRNVLQQHQGFLTFLTGTPIERGPGDMWSLLNLMYPDVFSSYWAFFNYFTALEFNQFTGYAKIVGVSNVEVLRDLIRPFYIRRTLEEIAPEIKEPIHAPEFVELSKQEQEIYDLVESGKVDKKHLLTRDDTTAVGRMIGSRMAAISTALVSIVDVPSSKIERLGINIQDAPDAQHVVFTSFRKSCEMVQAYLISLEIPCELYYAGKDPEVHRRFARGEGPKVLVATPDSLGTGTDGFQVASYMHFLDIPWTHRVWRQSCARIVRIGKQGVAIIYHYVARGTVDQAIWRLIETKAETFDEVAVTRALLDLRK